MDGTVIPLEEVPDEVFSQKIMGDGIAIEPSGSVVYAPADGEITVVMEETGHACGMKLKNGIELLIHVGVDTVSMGGDGFELLVKEGDIVKCGTPLIKFNKEKIKAADHPCTTMMIVTEEGKAEKISMYTGMEAEAGKTTVVSWS